MRETFENRVTRMRLERELAAEKTAREIKEKCENRQSANLSILELLNTLVMCHPELRFGQLLSIYLLDDKIDIFNEESVDTLKRLENKEVK